MPFIHRLPSWPQKRILFCIRDFYSESKSAFTYPSKNARSLQLNLKYYILKVIDLLQRIYEYITWNDIFASIQWNFTRPTNFHFKHWGNENHIHHNSHQISNFWRYLWSVVSKCSYKMKQPKLYKMLKSLILLAHIFSRSVSLFLSHEYN